MKKFFLFFAILSFVVIFSLSVEGLILEEGSKGKFSYGNNEYELEIFWISVDKVILRLYDYSNPGVVKTFDSQALSESSVFSPVRGLDFEVRMISFEESETGISSVILSSKENIKFRSMVRENLRNNQSNQSNESNQSTFVNLRERVGVVEFSPTLVYNGAGYMISGERGTDFKINAFSFKRDSFDESNGSFEIGGRINLGKGVFREDVYLIRGKISFEDVSFLVYDLPLGRNGEDLGNGLVKTNAREQNFSNFSEPLGEFIGKIKIYNENFVLLSGNLFGFDGDDWEVRVILRESGYVKALIGEKFNVGVSDEKIVYFENDDGKNLSLSVEEIKVKKKFLGLFGSEGKVAVVSIIRDGKAFREEISERGEKSISGYRVRVGDLVDSQKVELEVEKEEI